MASHARQIGEHCPLYRISASCQTELEAWNGRSSASCAVCPLPAASQARTRPRPACAAAGELDRQAHSERKHVERRALLSTLGFAGLRMGELCGLRWSDVDLSTDKITVRPWDDLVRA